MVKQAETYLVREFAKLAGVSVRTLHFYDETGLLKPTLRTESNHRVYHQDDLLRLQQIVTLKYMGFSLSDIQRLLNSPAYDVEKSLRIQKEAIDQRIRELEQVSRALEQTLERFSTNGSHAFDWQLLDEIIKGIIMEDRAKWVAQYYTPEQKAKIQAWRQDFTQEELEASQRAWAEVIAGFEQNRHKPPDDPYLQELAGQAVELLRAFTRDDPGIIESLKNVYRDLDKWPPRTQPFDADTHRFMLKAMEIYRARHS